MNQHVNCTSQLSNFIEADQVGDTLLSAIQNARSRLEELSLDEQDSGLGAASTTNANYRSALEVLRTWDKPATTLKSAIEAVRFAFDEVRDVEAPSIVFPMLAAATSYFDKRNCSAIELLPEGEIILKLASELEVLEDRYTALDEEATTKGSDEPSFYKIYRDSEMRHVFDRILIIREAIGALEANSVKSAVVQLAVANTVMADITDSEHTDYEMGRLKRGYDRLIHSSMAVLLRETTLEKSAYAIDHMMSFYRNPWEPYEARVKEIDEKHGGFAV